ncbi:MAG: DUF533 domain-containing protein [Steroidobacteraceae bacterium]
MDTRQLLETLTRNPGASGALGGLAGSLLGNVLARGKGSGLLKSGGLAAAGYMAWQAWQRHQASQQGAAGSGQPGTGFGHLPQLSSAAPDAFNIGAAGAGVALKAVQAMIAVSRADGAIDPAERNRIFARVDEAGLTGADQDQVMRQLTVAPDMDELVRGVDKPEQAAQIYSAAVMAAHPVNRAEQAWLDMLAARLGLDPQLAIEIDRSVLQASG